MSDWPGGEEPVWTLLEPESMAALRAEPSADKPARRVAAEMSDEAFAESGFAGNAMMALQRLTCRSMCIESSRHG